MKNIRAWIGLVGLSLLASIAFIDYTIVYTSLPAIQVELEVPVIQLQLVMSIFSLSLAIFMIFVGKLADQFGKRKLFFIGIFIFACASLGAGFSTNFHVLVLFRFLQGIGAAIIFTSSSLLAPLSFPKEYQAIAISFYTTITGIGLTMGPFLGGIIVDRFGWQWIFFLNIPITIIGLLLAIGNVKETKKQENVIHDFPGLILFVLGLSLIIFLLSYGNVLGWSSPLVYVGLILGIVLLFALVFVEKKQPSPLLDIEDITNRKVQLAILVCVAASVMTSILMLFTPLYFSSILAYSPTIMGLLMLATPLMQVIVSILWPKLNEHLGLFKVIILGIVTCLAAAIIMMFFTQQTTVALIIPTLVLMGIIWGITNAAGITLATSAVPEEKAGSVIGLIFTSWNVAGAILTTLSSVLFSLVEGGKLQQGIQAHQIQLSVDDHQRIASALSAPEHAADIIKTISPNYAQEILVLFKQAFMDGFHVVMGFSSVLLVICLLTCLALTREPTNMSKQ